MADEALLLDTSAALPLLLARHPRHDAVARRAKGRILGLSGHAQFETFSVLTRLPPPERVSTRTARDLIARTFPQSPHLGAHAASGLLDELADGRLAGGAVFDALVAAAAREAGTTLLSCDRRAAATYRALGTDFELL
jgi:predicted nucleic acid-binding protein